jgi:hypothetical protein
MTREEKSEDQIPSGNEPAEDSEHFFVCSCCGQAVNRREAAQILHHMQTDHRPLVSVGLWVIA